MSAPVNPRSIRLFSPDLDGTLLGNPAATRRFRRAWEKLSAPVRPLLAYNSGRPVHDVRALIAAGQLPEPDYIIGGVGTELHDFRARRAVREFSAQFPVRWDLATIEAIVGAVPGVTRQPVEFLHHHKSSWHLPAATPATIAALRRRLRTAGLAVQVIYSSGRDLDVLPARANKGNALAWLCARRAIPLSRVLVAGDTANDSAMFRLRGVHGIVVANAQRELFATVAKRPVFRARRAAADGVLDGLRHFGVVLASGPDRAAVSGNQLN